MIVRLLTYWKDGELECCCPIKNKCRKLLNCEELEFKLDESMNAKQLMNHDSYKRVNGRIQQRG